MSKIKMENMIAKCPEDLQKRILGLKLVLQRPDHHPEGNVWIHTKIVFNRLTMYNDKTLLWAALFHDIGKDVTTKKNEKGILQAIGHEDVSADLVKTYAPQIDEKDVDWILVEEIVKNHMRIKQLDKMGLSKRLEMRRIRAFGYLQLFTEADDMNSLIREEIEEANMSFPIKRRENVNRGSTSKISTSEG